MSKTPWIVSKRDDLTFFIGSAAIGYTLMAIALANGALPVALAALIAVLIDGPHVYSTATRILLDRDEFRRQRFILLFIVPLCLVGPLLILSVGFQTFFIVIVAWGQYHISKQHMGFVLLYKRKANEREDFKLDKYFTLGSLLLPYLYFVSAMITGTTKYLAIFLIPGLIFATYYIRHQSAKENKNLPKLVLLTAFIPLHWLAWAYAAQSPHSPSRVLVAAVTVNIGHSFQYLRLMWFHNNNRYQNRSGILGILSRKWLYFVGAAVLLASPEQIAKFAHNELLSYALLGFLMLHYVVDSRIWRVRGDFELAQALKLTA